MEPEVSLKLRKHYKKYTHQSQLKYILLHRKQKLDETWQEYIPNFTGLTEKAIGGDPANITNRVTMLLFIKNLYNKDIRKRLAGVKTINTLANAFK